MTINEKIHMVRTRKGMSQAELAFKTGFSIIEIISFETNGTRLSGYILIQILNAFTMTTIEFKNI